MKNNLKKNSQFTDAEALSNIHFDGKRGRVGILWSEEEKKSLIESIREHGKDLKKIGEQVTTKNSS